MDPGEHLLLRNGVRVKLEGKVFETLVVLVQNSGHLVQKAEFMNQVWPDTVVEENNLEKSISVLRKILSEDGSDSNYIETVRGQGYRFATGVRVLDNQVHTLIRHESRTSVTIEEDELESLDEGELPLKNKVRAPGEIEQRRVGAVQGEALSPGKKQTNALLRHRLRLATVLAAALLIIAGVIYLTRPAPAIDSLAVLPFVNTSNDPNTEYFCDGLTESLINSFSRLTKFRVVSRTTAFHYKGAGVDPIKVGRELNVRAVLTGRVVQQNDTASIQVELIDVATNSQLWGERYTMKLSDTLKVQENISQEITEKLRLRLSGQEQKQLTKRYTEDTIAYHLYLRGRYDWNKRNAEGFKKGIDYFNQAIERDPTYALAYAGLADCYNMLGDYAILPPRESFPKARAAAMQALQIDEQLAEAHNSLALVKLYYDWDFPAAEKEFKRAIELNPNYPTAHQWYGELLMVTGRFDESIGEMKRAQELDPLSLIVNTAVGYAYWHAHRYDEAIEQLHKTLELEPNFLPAVSYLEMAYEQKGMNKEALATELQSMTLSGGYSLEEIQATKEAFAKSGMRGVWLVSVRQIQERSRHRYVAPVFFAAVYAELGDKDKALAWLEKALEERSGWMVHLKVDPRFDRLRSDSRFADVIGRVGL